MKDGKSQEKPTFVNSSKETIVRTTKFRALDESKVRVIHYRIKLTFIGLGRIISSEKTARLNEMEDGGEHVPTHKPVGVCGNLAFKTPPETPPSLSYRFFFEDMYGLK